MNNIKFQVGNGNTTYDYTPLVEKVVWSGRKGAAPRSLSVTLFDSEGFNITRANVNVAEGQTCALYDGNKELFRGLLMTETRNSNRKLSLKAWDKAIYLANSKDSFSYKNKTASDIFKDCCKKAGLSAGGCVSTGHKIGEITKSNATYWDVIQSALEETYKTTGRRYYVSCECGKMYLRQRKSVSTMTTLDLTSNTESYEQTRSIYDTRTRIKLVTSKNKTKQSWVNTALEKKIGKFAEVEQVDTDATSTEVKQKINTFKKEKSIVAKSLTWTGIGDSNVISGGCVYTNISPVETKQVMYVEEDTHTFEDGKHQMKLKLSYYPDYDNEGAATSSSSGTSSYKVNAKSGLHLRTAPNAKILATMPYNTTVTSDGKTNGGWLHVKYGSKEGYAYKQYLTKV